MTTTVIKTVKASGGDFTTLDAFCSYLNGLDLVALDWLLYCHLYYDQSGGQILPFKTLMAANADATRRCIVCPAPGLGVNDLDTTSGDYGTVGIELTVNDAGYRFAIGTGVDLIGLRINCASASNGNMSVSSGGYTGTGVPGPFVFSKNRLKFTAGNRAIYAGSGGFASRFEDNLFIRDGALTGTLLTGQLNEEVQRNTFVNRNGGTGSVLSSDYGNGGVCQNNMFRDCGATPVDRTGGNWSAYSNNFANVAITGTSTGFTVNTGVNALTQGNADSRPTAAGPLIAGANATANGKADLYGGNRGTAPDVGAIQRTAAAPLPSGTVTAQTVSGQTVTISGTTTGSPTSALATLPAASTPNGAVSQGPIAVTLGTGTFTVTFTVPSGSYASPVVTLTNAGGSQAATGGSTVEILGVDGTPTGPGGGTDTTAPTLTLPTATSSTSTTATGTITTDEANGTLYTLASINATESAATVKAGAAQTVTTTGAQAVAVTGLTPSTTYYLHYVHRDLAGNDSAVANSASFPTAAGGDVTAPTLTSPTAAASTSTTATGSVTTNEANGTLYRLIDTSATATAAAVKAGSAQAVSATGVQSVSFTGLSPLTTYYAHYLHRDAAGNDSAVANSAQFPTQAPPATAGSISYLSWYFNLRRRCST